MSPKRRHGIEPGGASAALIEPEAGQPGMNEVEERMSGGVDGTRT
jgi:hypothetical protein